MGGPQRKPDQTAISVSMSKSMLDEIDRRAEALGLNRSQYLTQLARQDLAVKGSIVLHEKPTAYNTEAEISSARKVEIGDDALNVVKKALGKTKGKASHLK